MLATSIARHPAAIRAVIWILCAALLFTGSAMLVKLLGQKLPPSEVALFRAAAGMALIVVVAREFRQLREPRIHLLRGLFGGIGVLALVHAYASGLSLALVTAIYYARVVITMALASVFLGERSKGLIGALIVCAIGAGVALYPNIQAGAGLGILTALIAALGSSVSQVCARQLAQSNPPSMIVATFGVLCVAVIAGPSWLVWVTPAATDIPFLIGVGACAVAAQYCVVRAYRLATASSLAMYNFIEIPLAAVIDFAAFGKIAPMTTVVGAALIVAASVHVTRVNARS